MPSNVYTTTFLAATITNSSVTQTQLPGFVAVLKDLDLVAHSNPVGSIAWLKGFNGQFIYYTVTTTTSPEYHHWESRAQFNPGQSWIVGCTGTWDFTVTGYELTQP